MYILPPSGLSRPLKYLTIWIYFIPKRYFWPNNLLPSALSAPAVGCSWFLRPRLLSYFIDISNYGFFFFFLFIHFLCKLYLELFVLPFPCLVSFGHGVVYEYTPFLWQSEVLCPEIVESVPPTHGVLDYCPSEYGSELAQAYFV